jgi:hypothetical protein
MQILAIPWITSRNKFLIKASLQHDILLAFFYHLKKMRTIIMDDIVERDIKRAQIGKKKEVAYEIINHSKVPATNLPPLRCRDKNAPLTSEKNQNSYPADIEVDIHGTPKKILSHKCIGQTCDFVNDPYGKATVCGKPTIVFCSLCGKRLCSDHQQPEHHNCSMIFY